VVIPLCLKRLFGQGICVSVAVLAGACSTNIHPPIPSDIRPSLVQGTYDLPSSVYPAVQDNPVVIPGVTNPNAQGAQILELRGWLTSVLGSAQPHSDGNTYGPHHDFEMAIELDPKWCDDIGLDPLVYRVIINRT
jgi:hypothetical protein